MAFSSSGCPESRMFSGITWKAEPIVTSEALIGWISFSSGIMPMSLQRRTPSPQRVLKSLSPGSGPRSRKTRIAGSGAIATAAMSVLRMSERRAMPDSSFAWLRISSAIAWSSSEPPISWRSSTTSASGTRFFAQRTMPMPMPARATVAPRPTAAVWARTRAPESPTGNRK